MATVTVRQIASPIRRKKDQRATLVGLGLNRIGRVSTLEDTPSVRGMIAKQQPTGVFQLPSKLVQAYQAKQYDGYYYADLGATPALPFNSVPLNFLSSADTTGGNSGSAVMNGKGELIGLNFDSTYESISKDWYFNESVTRAIHVDIRYVLWLMQYVDNADNLLAEMEIVR